MQQIDLKDLLDKHRRGTLSKEELEILENWYLQWDTVSQQLSENEIAEVKKTVYESLPVSPVRPVKSLWPRLSAAASIILIFSFTGYHLFYKKQRATQVAEIRQDVSPGHNQATLTLANGRKIVLRTGLSGTLAQQGNMRVHVTGQNAVVYTPDTAHDNARIEYNTLSTANGEQSPFPLILADGTKVWLNSASSITYPTAFTGSQRLVKVSGEAYFEVMHDAEQPFKVSVKGQIIEDIGTRFNVNAYEDEPTISTTLLEGSVRVVNSVNSVILKPGQRASQNKKGHAIQVSHVNTDPVVAWRNGKFSFDRTDLHSLMRQIARWYNLKVIYTGNVINDEFDGEISKDVNLSKMLKILETGDIHFKIRQNGEQKELVITP